jgi:L,D-transpeptidase ErfK/SrfK
VRLIVSLLLATAHLVDAGAPGDREVVGVLGTRTVKASESLMEIAREHDVGYNAIAAANPGLDAFVPTPGAVLTIPTQWILPPAPAPGTIVVNVSEMRLYLFAKGGGPPITFPVGVGMDEWKTPVGTFTVVNRTVNPTWRPPASIRRADPELPASVPPGPDNPLGTHALRLSAGSLLIHGTDAPYGVGRKASHGCIRLYPEDIPRLFDLVPLKTRVTMVRQPVKVGVRGGRILVEVHDDPDAAIDVRAEAASLLAARGLAERVDARRLEVALAEHRGIPVDVSLDGL